VKIKKVYFAKTGFLLAALALAGCGAGALKKDEDSVVIKDRAVQRWNLLIAHEADKAYELLSPGYRQTKTRDDYAKEMNARPVRWNKVSFASQDCDADTCKVHLSVDYSLNMGGPVGTVKSTAPLEETWIRVAGHWYYLPNPVHAKIGQDKES
jgi:hypothetical protein